MKKKILISLVIYGKSYIKNFQNLSLDLLINSLSQIDQNLFSIDIIISSKHTDDLSSISSKLLEKFNVIEFKINDSKKYGNYSILNQEQINHTNFAKEKDYEYIFYFYADFLINVNYFINSINTIEENNKVVLGSFALLINSSKSEKIIDHLKKNELFEIEDLLVNNHKEIISNFHLNYNSKNLNLHPSFCWRVINNKIFIKTIHIHPVLLKISQIKFDQKKFTEFFTIDNGFFEAMGLDLDQIYIEENLANVLSFSFDDENNIRNHNSKNSNQFLEFKRNFHISDDLVEYLSLENFSNIINNKITSMFSKLDLKIAKNNTLAFDVSVDKKNQFFSFFDEKKLSMVSQINSTNIDSFIKLDRIKYHNIIKAMIFAILFTLSSKLPKGVFYFLRKLKRAIFTNEPKKLNNLDKSLLVILRNNKQIFFAIFSYYFKR